MIGWEVISAVVTILVSLGAVFIAYGRQWSKLAVLLDNLSDAVKRLTSLADSLTKEQATVAVELEKIKADVKSNTNRVGGIERRLDKVLYEGFRHYSEGGG